MQCKFETVNGSHITKLKHLTIRSGKYYQRNHKLLLNLKKPKTARNMCP